MKQCKQILASLKKYALGVSSNVGRVLWIKNVLPCNRASFSRKYFGIQNKTYSEQCNPLAKHKTFQYFSMYSLIILFCCPLQLPLVDFLLHSLHFIKAWL